MSEESKASPMSEHSPTNDSTGSVDQNSLSDDKIREKWRHRHFWRKCRTDFKENENCGDNETVGKDGEESGAKHTFRHRVHSWRQHWGKFGPPGIPQEEYARIRVSVDGQTDVPMEAPLQMPPGFYYGFGHRHYPFGRWRGMCGRRIIELDDKPLYREFDFIHGS